MSETQKRNPVRDYSYAIYAGIMSLGRATLEQAAAKKRSLIKPPAHGNVLTQLRFTPRRKEKLPFDAEETDMTVYVCCRYENQKGKAEQWSRSFRQSFRACRCAYSVEEWAYKGKRRTA
jgi:hypothetical protein